MKTIALVLALSAAAAASGAWYWPFGNDDNPQRLHRLLEKANDCIEAAEDAALEGDGDKAVENYRNALAELERVEAEHPDRAATAEFSPLRNKRAACLAAIDSIRFAQVNDNERAITVSDTSALQKKWNEKHGIAAAAADGGKPAKPAAEKSGPPAGSAARQAAKPAAKPAPAKPEAAPAPAAGTAAKPVADPPAAGGDFAARMKQALGEVRAKDYAAADLLLEELAKERPNDLNVLLLRAAAQSGTGSNYAARRTLEKAMRAHPKSYLPYYNLAHLALTLGEGVESARQYYEMGRAAGGPVNAALEERLARGER